jgi:hypothetical protein
MLDFLSVVFFCSLLVEMLLFFCQMPFRHSRLFVLFSWAYQMYYISLATRNIGKLSLQMFPTYIKMSDLDFVLAKYFTLHHKVSAEDQDLTSGTCRPIFLCNISVNTLLHPLRLQAQLSNTVSCFGDFDCVCTVW